MNLAIIVPVRGRREFGDYVGRRLTEILRDGHGLMFSERSSARVWPGTPSLWTFVNDEEPFNKCHAMNSAAAMLIPLGHYTHLLFHDLDLVPPLNFFEAIEANLAANPKSAMQCFAGRSVLMCSQGLTEEILAGGINVDTLPHDHRHVSPSPYGAPGGSILMSVERYLEVGGWDEDLFAGYSCEDAMMWAKLEATGPIIGAENPPIHLFHLHHEANRETDNGAEKHLQTFLNLSPAEKKAWLAKRKDALCSRLQLTPESLSR